jgi:hypothetical protein
MHRFLRGALAVSYVAVIAGCSNMITGGELMRPGEVTGVIDVINQTSNPIDVVLISDCDASTYGLNRLPVGVAIAAGDSYRFTVSAGCWDVDAGTIGYGEARQRMTVVPNGMAQYTVTG